MKPSTEFKRRKRRPKVKFKVEDINYKNVDLLKNFMNDKGKISPARVTGLEAKIQRKIAKAMQKQKEENNQLVQLQQQLQQMQQQLQQTQKQLQQSQQKIQQLNENKIQLEQAKLKADSEVEWFKAQTDRTFKQQQVDNDTKRVQIELDQLHDGDPYNDKVREG